MSEEVKNMNKHFYDIYIYENGNLRGILIINVHEGVLDLIEKIIFFDISWFSRRKENMLVTQKFEREKMCV